MEKYFFWHREYFFEYNTPKPKIWRVAWRVLVAILLLFILNVFEVLLVSLIMIFYMCFFSARSGYFEIRSISIPSLTVRISEEEIFLRTESIIHRKRIPIWHLKNVSLIKYTNEKYHYLARYHGEVWFWFANTFIFTDGTSTNSVVENGMMYSETRGADLELVDGRHIFVAFDGVEKFVEVLMIHTNSQSSGC